MGNQNSSRSPSDVTSGLVSYRPEIPSPSPSPLLTHASEESTSNDKPPVCISDDAANSSRTNEGIVESEKSDEVETGNKGDEWDLQNSFDSADLVGLLFKEDNDDIVDVADSVEDQNKVEYEEQEPPNKIGGESDNMGQVETNIPESTPTPTPPSYITKEKKKRKKAPVKFFTAREVRNGKVIGEGGFGRILQGNLSGGMPVVIKFFHAPLSVKTLQTEVDGLMNLKHKNIVEVYGIVEQLDAIDCPQVVLQFFPEGNILQYLSRKENPDDMATLGKFALDVIEGCQYLRHKNIVHGNLAARNILIEKIIGKHKTYYNAKVSDMGLIRFAEATGANYVKLPGTERVVPLRWVPKEIVDADEQKGADYTFASDVWSFGVLLWEIWTRGAIPYGASYSNMRVLQFLKDGYSPLKVHRPTDCPGHVVAVMESIFKVDPKERPTVDALGYQFRSFRGFGKENKFKAQGPGKAIPWSATSGGSNVPTTTSVEDAEGTSSAGTSFPYPHQSSVEDELMKDKIAKKKKKKNKTKEKFAGPPPYYGAGASGRTVSTPLGTFEGSSPFHSAEGVGSERVVPPPMYSGRPVNRQNSFGSSNPGEGQPSNEATVAALLMRVNQLERERNESRRGRGSKRGSLWGQRLGPPNYRGGYHNHPIHNQGHSPVMSPDGASRQTTMGQSEPSPLPPPSSSQAPPPYTEDPLPHHSSSPFVPPDPAMTPEYEYSPRPGPSHHHHQYQGRVLRSGSGGGRGTGAATPSSSGREDYLRKVRQLAEEIEVLRAEKMTQELLKKSAELASLMKHMTVGVTEESEPRYTPSRPTPRPPRGRPYQDYGYRYSPQGQHGGWQEEPVYDQEDEFMPHHHHSRGGHPYQYQPPSRRPYYGKGPGRGRGFGKRGGGGGGGSMDFGPGGSGQ